MLKRKVYIVPHSHWDREWYFTQEDSKLVLSENLNFLLDYLKEHPEFPTYVFDGQYSVMHDFLAKYPERAELLKSLVVDGRLKIGPWYTQCDSLLNQTESIIRNLLLGKAGAEQLGASMNIGYLPDIFGQHAYLPSIFKRFGINAAILQRGLYTAQIEEDLNFDWQSPNGDQIQTNNIYFGYGPGKFLSSDSEYLASSLLPILDKLAQMTPESKPLLLPAGGDQVLIRTHFPKIVAELNELELDYQFILSNYEEFMEASSYVGKKIIAGELIAGQKSRIHSTIRSQRVDIKMLNARVEEKIYQQLEPLALIIQNRGGSYPQAWINDCLRKLFDVHAHDSLSGCNSDETNFDIEQRLLKIERVIDGYINILKKQLARGIATDAIVAINLIPKSTQGLSRFIVFSRSKEVALKGVQQVLLNSEYISGGQKVRVTAGGEQTVELPGYYRHEIMAEVAFEGLGYRTFELTAQPIPKLEDGQNTIENEFYRIEIDAGSLVLTRKYDQRSKKNWFDFENITDAGDSYDFSPQGLPVFSTDVQLVNTRQSNILSEMTIQTRLGEQIIETKIRLKKGSDLIKLEHKLNNQIKDHRVRVRFHGKNDTGLSYGDQGYSLQKRLNVNPNLVDWREKGFAERPQGYYPLERFVVVPETEGNVSLYTKGLKEYEATDDYLALTLFRSVGLLGRDDLAWRPGRASGINNKVVETPDAQLQKKLEFAYAYRWSASDDIAEAYLAAEYFADNQLTYQLQSLNSFEERIERFELPQPQAMHDLPKTLNLLTLPANIFVSSLKKAEENERTILRVFNPAEQSVLLPDLKQVDLDEHQVERKATLQAKDFASLEIEL